MANRRMFSQRIVGDENFLEMPASSQNLYFHLGIYADDDGFVNPQKILRMIGANPDDLKIIVTKGFVIPFKTGVVVITNWKENNYIQSDRYTPTIYQEQLKELSCIQNVYKLDTQVRLGKVRLELSNNTVPPKGDTSSSWRPEFGEKYIQAYNKLFNKNCLMTPARVAKLKLRFKTFNSEQISKALVNLSKSKWHQGDNDRGWVADPDFLIRNDEMIDKWINIKGGDNDGR